MERAISSLRGLVIVGTDTGVGKTIVSSVILNLFKNSGAYYLKPVQTGAEDDALEVERLTGLGPESVHAPLARYALPAAPTRAAAAAGKVPLDFQSLKNALHDHTDRFWILEGAGGLEVPFNDAEVFGDWVERLSWSVIVVASTRLGTINHTLLTLRSLRARGAEVLGVILNGEKDEGLAECIQKHGDVRVIAEFENLNRTPDATDIERWGHTLEESLKGVFILSKNNHYSTAGSLSARDRKVIWHPYTQHLDAQSPLEVESAKGAELILSDGSRVIDAISSWWVTVHGHAHAPIARKINEQAHRLEQVIFAGATHEPAVKLAETLVSACRERGTQLQRVFYSDNGSTAVEAALKMASQYHLNRQHSKRERFERKVIVALDGAYHGDTLGAMALSARGGFHQAFESWMPEVKRLKSGCAEDIAWLQENGNRVAVVFAEPEIQGAAGMRRVDSAWLAEALDAARAQGALIAFDEVFTGFYRTGTCFAFERVGRAPDLLCLSKGLTGGFMPMGATLATEAVFNEFLSSDRRRAFMHGHSFTANPIACAAALESWSELHKPEAQEKLKALAVRTRQLVSRFSGRPGILRAESLGLIGIVEVSDAGTYWEGQFGQRLAALMLERGILIRPLGPVVYTIPSLAVTLGQLDAIYDALEHCL